MKSATAPRSVFLGWDVGGWNCDRNALSRDAIIILDAGLRILGEPWRGNLRQTIAEAKTTRDWIRALFGLCGADAPAEPFRATLAIDTPLGFSREFVALVSERRCADSPDGSDDNRYLFRETERHVLRRGKRPLSAVKDMIGSQATKGMHALAKFAPIIESCGVWTDGRSLTAIETYPSVCRRTPRVVGFLDGRPTLKHADCQDARVCALVAYLFATDRKALEPPGEDVSEGEGWIWVPRLLPAARTLR